MKTRQILEDLKDQIVQLIEKSSAKDLSENARALMTQGLAKLDMVTREEFDTHTLQIEQMREKMESLEKRLFELENKK